MSGWFAKSSTQAFFSYGRDKDGKIGKLSDICSFLLYKMHKNILLKTNKINTMYMLRLTLCEWMHIMRVSKCKQMKFTI